MPLKAKQIVVSILYSPPPPPRTKYEGRLCFQFVCHYTPGGTPSPSHNASTGPMSFLGYPSDWSKVPSGGGATPVQLGGYPSPPSQVRMPNPLARTGVPPPGQVRMRYPLPLPPPRYRLCLDRLWHERYTSCGFAQEACLVLVKALLAIIVKNGRPVSQ